MLWYKFANYKHAASLEEIIKLRKEQPKAPYLQREEKRRKDELKNRVPPPPGSSVQAPAPQAKPTPTPVAPGAAAPSAAPRTTPQPMRVAPTAPQAAPSPMVPKQWGLPARGQEPSKVFEAPKGMVPARTPTQDQQGRAGLEEGRPPEMQEWLRQKQRQKKPL